MRKALEILGSLAPPGPDLRYFLETRLLPFRFARDNFLQKTGQPSGQLWILTEGFVRRHATEGERELTSRFFCPGSLIYEAAEIGPPRPATSFLSAETEAIGWRLSEADTLAGLNEFPLLREIVFKIHEADVRHINRINALLKLPRVKDKVLALHETHPELFHGPRAGHIASLLGMDESSLYKCRKKYRI